MVGKTENILTEFDYNNITIVDPNKVVDELGNVRERYVNQEDLVMYANLEAKMIPRTKLAIGVATNDAIQTLQIASINFLKPGNKTFLDNTYTDEITGKDSLIGEGINQTKQTSISNPARSNDFYIRQTTMSGGKAGSIDTELLGITSINVSLDTSFLSTIRVELVDVKGKSMFESGNNSPYAAFFNMPFPKFYLTLKGYFGKALRLELMLQSFNTRFDYNTSNFNVSLVFYTYKYTVLTETSIGMLLALPHMFKSSINSKSDNGGETPTVKVNSGFVEGGYEKIREVYSEYKSKGLISEDFPEITIIQLKERLENFVTNVMDNFTKQNMDPLTDLDAYQKVINEYKGNILIYQQDSWFNKYMDKDFPFILKNKFKTKVYTFKSNLNKQNKADAISNLKSLINEYNKKLNDNETVGQNGSYEVNGKKRPSSINFNITYEKTFLRTFENVDEIDFEETLRLVSGNTQPTPEVIQQLKTDFQRKNLFQAADISVNPASEGSVADVKVVYQYFAFENNEKEIINSVSNFSDPTFIGEIAQIEKKLKAIRLEIEEELTKALSDLIQNSNNGIGFSPTIRNVLAVIFASTDGFLRLLDDTHREAWEKRNDPNRKAAILDKQTSDASPDNIKQGLTEDIPVYPWPQFLVQTNGENGHEEFELKYPGDSDVIQRTRAFDYELWPEVEFEEEFIKGYTQRLSSPQNQVTNFNEVKDSKRISFNVMEFPINNIVYSNKEEIKFLFEIYERTLFVSNYTKLSRCKDSVGFTDKVTDAIAEAESNNVVESLGTTSPFLIDKIKNYGFNSSNYLMTLRHFSNDGTGQSWENYLNGVFNTGYIRNLTENAEFEFMDLPVLYSPISSPVVSVANEDKLNEFITGKTISNVIDFTDIYPFTNDDWCKQGLSNGNANNGAKSSFETSNILNYNKTKKIITNFTDSDGIDEKRPITNFVYKKNEVPFVNSESLKTFYETRTFKSQLITEGNLNYGNYNGNVASAQTSSMFNNPVFINSIIEGVTKFRNNSLTPYTVPAYLFLNSLPLATLREKYQSLKSNDAGTPFNTSLDYIFATMKKFGAIHKVPYAWILKIGSIWHRYKVYVETGNDILTSSWSNFQAIQNFDPTTNSAIKNYGLILNGSPVDIVLQKDTILGAETSTLINTGFYPGLINEFNVFYQGYEIINTDTEIKGTCSVLGNVMSVTSVNHNSLTSGYVLTINGLNSPVQIISQINGNPGGDGNYSINITQSVSETNFTVTNATNIPYSDQSIQDSFKNGLNILYSTKSLINYSEGFDESNLLRDLRVISWSVLAEDNTGKNQYVFPSSGSKFNQTNEECFKSGKKIIELNNNTAMYNGSIRSFWAAPQYGYFDLNKLIKPTPEEYLKTIFINQEEQENYSLNGNNIYTKISEIFSVFEKGVLDSFEEEFLNFSKSKYDFVNDGKIKPLYITEEYAKSLSTGNTESITQQTNIDGQLETNFKNFQLLYTSLMKIPKVTGETGDQIIEKVQNEQTINICSILSKFMNYDVAFKFGNPSNYNRRLFGSFTTVKLDNSYTWDLYNEITPNAIPVNGGTTTLSASKTNYPDAWKALELYVGFSDISSLSYTDNGSYITDFFIDFNVAFTENNIINLYPMIKIYATQKLTQFQVEPTPPSLPPTQPYGGAVLETYELGPNDKGAIKILIFKQGPRKFAVLFGENDAILYEGEKVPIPFYPSSQGIVNEALNAVFGNSPELPEITNIIKAPTPEFPSTPDPVGKWSLSKLTNQIDLYLESINKFQNVILDSVFNKLRNTYANFTITSESIKQTVLEGPQTKIDLWETFKALNDKWIAGNDWKQKTLFEDILLLDRASRNIGDYVLCDVYKLKHRLNTMDPTKNVSDFVNTILTENNFSVLYIPNYVNFYNVQEAQKNPKPKLDNTSEFANNLFGTFMNVDYRNSSTKMCCFYAGKPSTYVDIKDNVDFAFRDDSFEITKSSNNPLAENQINKKDWDKSNKCVGFSVDIGPQNQSIFYGFNVGSTEGQATAESLENISQMANQAGNRKVGVQNLSLYNVYKNRSYSCTVSMMGNAMIIPTMYFNLRYVPMFHGPYMILKVTHTITPGHFETILEGIRQPTASLPKVENYLQVLKTNLLNSIIEESKKEKSAKSETNNPATNVKSDQAQTTSDGTTTPANSASANQSCSANTSYSNFVVGPVTNVSITTNEIIQKIKTTTSTMAELNATEKENLNLILFSAIYIATWNGSGFQTNNNNYIGLNIQDDWGKNYMKNTYYCDSQNRPFASFENADDSIKFLAERWKLRVKGLLIEGSEPQNKITKFWIINYAANTSGRESVYNTYPSNDLNFINNKVINAITLYKGSNL